MRGRFEIFLLAAVCSAGLTAQEISISVDDTASTAAVWDGRSTGRPPAGRHPFRMKFQLQGMDSVLKGLDTLMKHLPIPDEVHVDDRNFRFRVPEGPWTKGFDEPRMTERDGILKFGSDVVIGRNEIVHGDVVVFGGSATVYGQVEGGVVTVKGDVKLASTSRIDGDIVCIWGNAEVDEGVTAGKTTVLNFGKWFQNSFNKKPSHRWVVFFDVFRIMLLLVIAALIVSAFPKQTGAVTGRVQSQYARSLITGLVAVFLIPAVFLILLVTIIGIPVALLVLPLVIAAGFLLGGTAVAFRIGQLVCEQTGWKCKSSVLLVGAGIVLLECIAFLGKLTSLASPALGKVFFLFSAFVFLCTYIPGFGAVVSTRFGTRPKAEAVEKKKGKGRE
jgi:cytoskeletal protein CcmA (bactofilin family)